MLTRRTALTLTFGAAACSVPPIARAASAREITWDDLIPPDVPYAQIIGEGEMDEVNDTWSPIFDENATKLNEALDGPYIQMPGYILPLEIGVSGVTSFILVPYVGACIHVPPPPPNQLVFVTTNKPWPAEDLWDAVWVTGELRTHLQTNEIAETGYALFAEVMEPFDW